MSIHTRLTRVHAAGGRPEHDQHDDSTLVAALAWLQPRLAPTGTLLLVHMWFGQWGGQKDLFRFTGSPADALPALAREFPRIIGPENSKNCTEASRKTVVEQPKQSKMDSRNHCFENAELIDYFNT